MSDDNVSRTDAPRGTNTGGTPRRRVLGGVAAAVGATLGFSGAATAEETTHPGPGGVGQNIPTCDPDCSADLYCCEEGSSGCIEYCWFCNCW